MTCLWCTHSREWPEEGRVALGIGNPFEYLVPLLGDHPWQMIEADWDEAGAIRRMLEFEPDVVLVSGLTNGAERANRLIEAVRAHNASLRVIWGGWHASAFPDQVLESGADTVVLGSGESALAMVDDPGQLPAGVLDVRREPRVWTDPIRLSLGEMVSPGLPLGPTIASMSAIDGCPRTCRFCAQRKTHYSVRPAEFIEREIAGMLEQEVGGIFLLDGNPMAHFRAFAELCRVIEGVAGDRLPWRAFGDANSIDDKSAEGFRRAGGKNIYVGLESPQAEIQERYGLGKKLGRLPIASVAETMRRQGVYMTASLIIGDPRCEDDVSTIVRYLEMIRPDFLALHQLMPIPGTPMWHELQPLVRPDLSFGDLDQLNPEGFFIGHPRPTETMNEIFRQYFGGEAYARTVEERFVDLGDEYLRDMQGVRHWLGQWQIDPWKSHAVAQEPPERAIA